MRVVALCALLALACASPAWNELTGPTITDGFEGNNDWFVSQTGPAPGRTTITTPHVLDVRTGNTWTAPTTGASGTSFTAPYAGCFYFYKKSSATDYTLVSGPKCTKYSEYNETGSPNWSPASVALQLGASTTPSTFQTTSGVYGFTLRFNVDAGYAGVAFEFLNLNVADWANQNTRCGVGYDNLIATQVVGADTVIKSPHSYNSVTYYIYNRANGDSGTSDNGAWAVTPRTYSGSVSSQLATYTVTDFNTVLSKCGWLRDESNANATVFNAQIRITTAQQGRNIRGLLLPSYKETIVKIGIAFFTAVNASVPRLDIQSPIINLYQITKQVFDPVQNRAYLLLYTSSQGPYQLSAYSAVCDSAAGTGCSGWTAGPENGLRSTTTNIGFDYLGADANDVSNLKLNGNDAGFTAGVSNDGNSTAECYTISTTSNTVSNYSAAVATSNYPVCGQYWSIKLNPNNNCGNLFTSPQSQTLDGSWKLDFRVGCHRSYEGSCQTPQVSTISITFNTASDNFCPRVVDTVSATAQLSTWQAIERVPSQDEQTQFVWGTTTYFTAAVTSTIGIQSLFTEEVAITTGGAVNNQAIYTTNPSDPVYLKPSEQDRTRQILYANGYNINNNQSSYFDLATIESSTCVGRSGQNKLRKGSSLGPFWKNDANGFKGTNCYFGLSTDTANIDEWSIEQYSLDNAANPVLTAYNYFQFRWNEFTSNATGDFAQLTQIRWDGRIQYDDRATKTQISAWIAPSHGRLTADSGASASVSRLTTGGPSGAAAPSAEVVSTTTIAVAAAAVAAVAVMAVVAAVVLRQRNAKAESETNLESVTLGSTSSIQQA